MNTASRMESTGLSNTIQISEATAKLLRASGKEAWIRPRSDAIDVKGKGVLQTFFLRDTLGDADDASVISSQSSGDRGFDQYDQQAKKSRQVQWTVEVMGGLLKQVRSKRCNGLGSENNSSDTTKTLEELSAREGATVLDEVQEIVHLPGFDSTTKRTSDCDNTELGPGVEEELEEFISCVADLYNNNPFHSTFTESSSRYTCVLRSAYHRF